MNRAQRRKYAKELKNDKIASICPECNNKARSISVKREGEETSIVCECCGKTVRQGEDITKSVPPGIYLPVKLDMLDMMIAAVKEAENKEETENVLEGNNSVDAE